MRYIESIKLIDGVPQQSDYHLRRSGVQLPPLRLPREYAKGIVKWRIVYGEGTFEESFTHYRLPSIRSLRLVDGSTIDYDRKYEDRQSIDSLFRQRGECDDILIVRHGQIADTSFCNVVFRNSDGLFTPSTPLLRGTKRQLLLDKGLIQERDIALDDLRLYHSITLINAMIELDDEVTLPIDEKLCTGIDLFR